LKLKDSEYFDRSPAVGLYQKLLILRNVNGAESKRRNWDNKIQDIGTMILRQYVAISEISTKFHNGEFDVIFKEADK
jgi:hypothetical protein